MKKGELELNSTKGEPYEQRAETECKGVYTRATNATPRHLQSKFDDRNESKDKP